MIANDNTCTITFLKSSGDEMMTFSNFTVRCRTSIMEWICTVGKKESRHVENTWLEEPLENNAKADSRNSHPSFKANGGGVFLSKS